MPSQQHTEDESYFVSMTDLMVGMLFVFIIMLMAFALNLKQQQTNLRHTTDALTQANIARTKMLEDIKESLKQRGVKVEVDAENGVLRLPEELLFSTGQYQLDPKGQAAVASLAEVLAQILPCYCKVPASERVPCPHATGGRLEAIYIEGHTDDQDDKKHPYGNWGLSAFRAIEVYRTLIEHVASLDEFRNDGNNGGQEGQRLLGVSGYADHRPVDKDNRDKNRRIDLRIIMASPRQDEINEIQKQVTPLPM